MTKPNLDLLRAYAIVLVLIDHFCLASKTVFVGGLDMSWLGIAGVYFFFVHTCLVLMWSLERRPHALDFYIRRIFRIYPLAILAVTCAASFHLPLGGIFRYQGPSYLDLASSLTLTQNFLDKPHSFLGVLWSLPLEVDMYLLLPGLFFFIRSEFQLWPLLSLWCLSVALARPLDGGNNFYTVIPCFLPGVMAFVLYRRTSPRLPAWAFPILILSLTAGFMARPAVSQSWPMCLVLGLMLPLFREITFKPLIRFTHEVAKYSYGIYLSHMFGLFLGFVLLPGAALWLKLTVSLVSTALLSIAAYHLIEKPMIDFGARTAAKVERVYDRRTLENAATLST